MSAPSGTFGYSSHRGYSTDHPSRKHSCSMPPSGRFTVISESKVGGRSKTAKKPAKSEEKRAKWDSSGPKVIHHSHSMPIPVPKDKDPEERKVQIYDPLDTWITSKTSLITKEAFAVLKPKIPSPYPIPKTLDYATPTTRVYNEGITALLFESMKSHISRAQLIPSFLKKMPKAELHNHLTGAIYAETFLKFAMEEGLFLDPVTSCFHRETGKGRISATDVFKPKTIEHEQASKAYSDLMSMKGKKSPEKSGHDHFFNAFKIIESITPFMPLEKQLVPVIKSAQEQNISYLEIMIERLVHPLPEEYQKISADKPGVKFYESCLTCLEKSGWLGEYVIKQSKELALASMAASKELGFSSTITHQDSPVSVGFILEIMRDFEDPLFFASIAAAMALAKHDSSVVGLNIVGPEYGAFAVDHFDEQMRILNFLYNKFGEPNIALHAGEVSHELSAPVEISSHIRDSIGKGMARRIGHGVSLVHEKDMFETLKLMKKMDVALEVCLSSNDFILGISEEVHPIMLYLQSGVPITLNTDDEAINRSDLTKEFVRAVKSYDFKYRDLKRFVRNALEYSFLQGESIYLDSTSYEIKPEFIPQLDTKSWTSKRSDDRFQASKKAQLQIRLERSFDSFEADVVQGSTTMIKV